MKQERTKDWVRLVPWAVLTMNSQRRSSTGITPQELFHGGRPASFFKTPFPDLGGSSCMVKNEGKGRKMTGFQRQRKIVVLLDILKSSQTSMADYIFL